MVSYGKCNSKCHGTRTETWLQALRTSWLSTRYRKGRQYDNEDLIIFCCIYYFEIFKFSYISSFLYFQICSEFIISKFAESRNEFLLAFSFRAKCSHINFTYLTNTWKFWTRSWTSWTTWTAFGTTNKLGCERCHSFLLGVLVQKSDRGNLVSTEAWLNFTQV